MSERPSLLRSAAVVSFMTLLSRVTGLFQTVFLAHFLGAGAASDAFFSAIACGDSETTHSIAEALS